MSKPITVKQMVADLVAQYGSYRKVASGNVEHVTINY